MTVRPLAWTLQAGRLRREGSAERKCDWLSVTQEQHLLTNFPLTPTVIPLETLSPQPPPSTPSFFQQFQGAAGPGINRDWCRRCQDILPPHPPQPSSERLVQGWPAWLPSLDLYLLAAYPQLTPPRLARTAAKDWKLLEPQAIPATHLPHTAASHCIPGL